MEPEQPARRTMNREAVVAITRRLARAAGVLLVMIGATASAIGLTVASNADLRESIEIDALVWLADRYPSLSRRLALLDNTAGASKDRMATLPSTQARMANWLAQKYRVGKEPLAELVEEAHHIGEYLRLDPALILAVAAIESNFNPLAQSEAGAQGLMQTITSIHESRYSRFGGGRNAFNARINLHVGAEILKACIDMRGSVEAGLLYYLGGGNMVEGSDNGYVAKVLAERDRLAQVATGATVPFN